MIRRLQSFIFNKSPYERPNQKWVCGRTAEGCPCRIGPDRWGRCRAQAACAPRKDGACWKCTRAQASGGSCTEGPRPDGSCAHPIPPCQPVRSVRSRRGVAARWATVMAVGLMALALHGSDAARWFSPGTLSAPHTQIGACSDCHQSFRGGPTGWIHAAFAGAPDVGDGDSGLCLSCHTLGQAPMNPHSLPDATLADMGKAAPKARSAALSPVGLELSGELFTAPGKDTGGIACANCHREHRGREAKLIALDNQRCQACHTDKFASFTNGHPDFGSYPYTRRTRIDFDHVKHMRQHFPDADPGTAPQQCADCHAPDSNGAQMVVKDFGDACAACHAGEIRGENAAGSTGIPVLVAPGLDLQSLRQAKAGIGHWPELSDRKLTSFMRTVFAADPKLSGALARFEKLDPMDLRGADPKDIQAVTRIAWATKKLVRDLVADGPAALQPELGDALGRDIAPAAARDLLGGLSYATVKQAQEKWFPDLARELALHAAGKAVPIPGGDTASADSAGASSDSGGGSSGSQADILSGGSGGDDQGDILSGGSGSDDQGDILSGGSGSDDQGDILSGGSGSDDQGDILSGGSGGDDQGDILSSDDAGASGDSGGGILSSEPQGGDLLGGSNGGESGADAAAAAENATLPEPNPQEWGRLGGWYQDFNALLYRPGGHGDRFLKRWLDLAGHAMASGRPGAKSLFADLGSPDAPGKCTKCHSVDKLADGTVKVNWASRMPTPGHQEFTRFVHGPHFTLLTDNTGCATCHAFNTDADYASSFDDRDPSTYHSNFEPITRETCGQCHVAKQAGNTCIECHNYHVGKVASDPTATSMKMVESAAGQD